MRERDSQTRRDSSVKYVNRRNLIKGVGTAGVVGLTGYTGGSEGETSARTSGRKPAVTMGNQNTITVEYWMYFGGGDADEMNFLINQFNKEHDKIQINRQRIPFDQMVDKLYTAVSSGNAPELVSMFMGYAGVMQKLVTPIGDYIQEETRNAYFDVAWKNASLNGELLCLPIDIHGHALYTNEDILSQAGVSTPFKSWSEFKSACNAIKEKTEARPFAFDDDMGATDFSRNFFMGLRQNGGRMLSKNLKKVAFDDTHGQRITELMWNITGKYGWDTKNVSGSGSRTKAFRRGDLAMMIGGNWDINNLQNESGEIIEGLNFKFSKPFFFPGDGPNVTFTESNSLYVPKNPKRSEEKTRAAVRAAEWITQNNPSWGFDAGHIPADKSVANSQKVRQSDLWQEFGTISTIFEMVSNGQGAYMPQAKIPMLSDSLWGWLIDIYGHNTKPDKGLKKGTRDVQQALNQAYEPQ